MEEKVTIKSLLIEYFYESDNFTLKEAEDYVLQIKKGKVKLPSIRARIYESIDKGYITKISRGVYQVINKDNTSQCILIQGNGRDLSNIPDNSIDAIITDHPYSDTKSNKGGNRSFADYPVFKYTLDDFKEKYRILKEGHYLVEFLPEENANNFEYLYQIKKFAQEAGFEYYTKVSWTKGVFKANTGRKSKNTEDILFLTKGKSASWRPDIKKTKKFNDGKDYFMSGCRKMLPATFNHQPTPKKEAIHQAEKPISLFEDILDYITFEGDVVLDQFAGSMNLVKACLNKKRHSIAIELEQGIFTKSKLSVFEYQVSLF